MTSKERVIATIRREEGDYVPCVPFFWSSPLVEGYQWTSEAERLEILIQKLGVDALLHFGVGTSQHPEVSANVWEEHRAGEKYPLIHKEVITKRGKLRAIVRKTDDWPHGLDIPYFSDFNVSRYVKPWLESLEDVEKWALVYLPPDDVQIQKAKEHWFRLQPLRERFQVPVMATYTLGLTGALHLFGAETGVLLSMDQPEALEKYVQIVHQADSKRLEVLLDFGVDLVRRNGWYESTDFWSPAQYQRFILPYMEKEIALAHEANCCFNYTMCTGIMPLVPLLAQLRFDSLDTVEPVLGDQDMPRLARELGATKCLWGGVSAPMHIGLGKPGDVKRAVRQAIDIFGKRGFILTAVPSIRPQWPWENVMAMFDEWRQLRY